MLESHVTGFGQRNVRDVTQVRALDESVHFDLVPEHQRVTIRINHCPLAQHTWSRPQHNTQQAAEPSLH